MVFHIQISPKGNFKLYNCPYKEEKHIESQLLLRSNQKLSQSTEKGSQPKWPSFVGDIFYAFRFSTRLHRLLLGRFYVVFHTINPKLTHITFLMVAFNHLILPHGKWQIASLLYTSYLSYLSYPMSYLKQPPSLFLPLDFWPSTPCSSPPPAPHPPVVKGE